MFYNAASFDGVPACMDAALLDRLYIQYVNYIEATGMASDQSMELSWPEGPTK